MKAQISLELLIYLSISSISLLAISSLMLHYMPRIKNSLEEYAVWLMLARLDTASYYYSNASVYLFIPQGLCNASIEGDMLLTRFGSFYFNPTLILSPSDFCPDNEYATLYMRNEGGYIYVGR
jgi:hypothetical protein